MAMVKLSIQQIAFILKLAVVAGSKFNTGTEEKKNPKQVWSDGDGKQVGRHGEEGVNFFSPFILL